MNKKLIYSLIAGTMFTLTSCDDFLDVQPASGFTPEYIFSSESEMKALMTRIYSSMTEDGLYGSNLASGLNTNTDVEMSSFKNNTVSTNGSDIGCFDSRPTWSVLNATWNNIYYAINYANDFLQAVQESPLFSDKVTGDTPSETQQMYGEVKTLRAMLYLDLIRTWGDVVFIIKPTEATDDFFSLGTTDRNVILEYLIDDLKNAGWQTDDVWQGENLAPVIREFEGVIKDGNFKIADNNLLKAHFLNVALKHNMETRKFRPVKIEQRARIDGFVSVIDALTVRQKYYNEIGEMLKNAG